jgi:hypothetical protein
MAAGSTYTPIATQTLTTNQSSVTFSTISGAYTDLVLIISFSYTASDYSRMRFNGDATSIYSDTQLYGNGTSAGSGRETNTNGYYLMDNYFTVSSSNRIAIVNIMNYSNTTTYKTILERSGSGADGTSAQVGVWRSTAAINSIALLPNSAQWVTGSTFTLYGILSA